MSRTLYQHNGKTLTAIQLMITIRKEMEFAMPPRGVTVHSTTVGGKRFERVTWRCEVEGCWYVRILADKSDATLETARKNHKTTSIGFPCPSPPMRESLVSGLPEIEKLWRELDDITDALVGKVEYRGMNSDALKGYAQGIAFCIVMKDRDIFQDVNAVSKEAAARWKMRNDKAPYRKTPTTQNTNGSWMVNHGWSEAEHGSVSKIPPVPTQPTGDTPAIKNAKAKLNPDKIKGIKNALAAQMFTHDELASTYGIPVALVRQIEAGTYGAEVS